MIRISTIKTIPEIEDPVILQDINSFVRVASNLKQLARSCSPFLIREAIKLEKYRRNAVETIRNAWLKEKRIDAETARKVIDFIYELYNDTIQTAEKEFEACLFQ
ncbi:MAG TPA: hypothetical protein ENG66_05080 [Thermococcus sp.]|nr:MAG: hypothetical protein DRP04_06330 [Archaeoglobales archaeon]HDH44746.1 hypothetical protein [Thermococcus sp.]